jgi:Fe-S-cluster containining protein
MVRRAVKGAARWSFELDLWADHALRRRRGERPYLLGGDCRRCASCCEAPAIQASRLVFHLPVLRRLFLWWQERVNGFVLVEGRPSTRTFVFRCTHFDPRARACDSYGSRPGACREYPRLQLWQASPEFLPGCGYRAVHARASRFIAVLEAQPMTADQRARLRRGLHLEP